MAPAGGLLGPVYTGLRKPPAGTIQHADLTFDLQISPRWQLPSFTDFHLEPSWGLRTWDFTKHVNKFCLGPTKFCFRAPGARRTRSSKNFTRKQHTRVQQAYNMHKVGATIPCAATGEKYALPGAVRVEV